MFPSLKTSISPSEYFIIVDGTPFNMGPPSKIKSVFSKISEDISSIFAGVFSPDIFFMILYATCRENKYFKYISPFLDVFKGAEEELDEK